MLLWVHVIWDKAKYRTHLMQAVSQSQQGSSLKKKINCFLFSSPGQIQSPEQVLMEQFKETAGTDEQPPSSEGQGSALTPLRPVLIGSCCCSAAGWDVGEWIVGACHRCKHPTTSWDLAVCLEGHFPAQASNSRKGYCLRNFPTWSWHL